MGNAESSRAIAVFVSIAAFTHSVANTRQHRDMKRASDAFVSQYEDKKPRHIRKVIDLTALSSSEDEAEPSQPEFIELGMFVTKIVGLRFYHGMVGKREEVILEREPRNPYDPNAIKALNIQSIQVGHIPKEIASAFAPLVDKAWVRLEGICPTGNANSTYHTKLEMEVFGIKEREHDIRRHLAARGIRLDAAKPKKESAPWHSGMLAPQAGTSVKTVRDVLDTLSRTLASVNDLAKLPDHPSPPPRSILKVDLLPYQRQGLAWMIRSEHPQPPKGKRVVQFWEAKSDPQGTYYSHTITHSAQRNAPPFVRGGILADDMGLGKTIQALSLILSDPSGAPIIDPSPYLESQYSNATLIVCPLSVIGNWSHVSPGLLTHYVHHGAGRIKDASKICDHDVVITTYHTLAMEYSDNESRRGALLRVPWRRVILDEGHLIKNPKAKMSRACCAVKAERRWILTGTPLTNTLEDIYSLLVFLRYLPFSNKDWFNRLLRRPVELGSEIGLDRLKSLMQGICIRRTKMMEHNGQPLVAMPPIDITIHKLLFRSDAEEGLYREAEAESQRRILSFMNREPGGLVGNYANVLELLLRLRQLCNHPNLCPPEFLENLKQGKVKEAADLIMVDLNDPSVQRLVDILRAAEANEEECCICLAPFSDGRITPCAHCFCQDCIQRALEKNSSCPLCRQKVTERQLISVPAEVTKEVKVQDDLFDEPALLRSTKLDSLVELLKSTPGDIKSCVFSQWTGMLDIVERRLCKERISFVRLDGKMSRGRRDEVIEGFGSPAYNARVMLISLKCGALGLNLTAASQVFLLDPWWNSSIMDQAIDRVYRIGQRKPVVVHQFIMDNTVEERVLQIQERKKGLISAAFAGIKYNGKSAIQDRQTRLAEIQEIFGL